MAIAYDISESIEKASWIRKMFEEGARLKNKVGAENVYDFSLGNPDLDPPEKFFSLLKRYSEVRGEGVHGYMQNAGFPFVKEKIAESASREYEIDLIPENIVMTCGAAGGLNTVFKTILNPGEEVIVPSPYFVEYGFYIKNHGGKVKLVKTNDDFTLDVESIDKAINKKTRAVLINSPNNPTSKVYPEEQIKELSQVLEKNKKKGNVIYLVSDEPYRKIVYDNRSIPSILKLYSESILVTSFSKSLSLAGERIGYLAVNPLCTQSEQLMAGLVFSNRILGYVNAPALMQRIIAEMHDESVDLDIYKRRRDIFCAGLKDAGYQYVYPEGTFYIFCRSPINDDIKYVKHLQKYNILVVPGTGFGGPGYFRISYTVSDEIIEKSLSRFKEAKKAAG